MHSSNAHFHRKLNYLLILHMILNRKQDEQNYKTYAPLFDIFGLKRTTDERALYFSLFEPLKL